MELTNKYRHVRILGPHMQDFLQNLDAQELEKVVWTFRLVETVEHIPRVYFKHLSECKGLYEIRIKTSRRLIRIFCVFGSKMEVMLLHGFIKKTVKTPRREIEKAITLMKSYYEKDKGE